MTVQEMFEKICRDLPDDWRIEIRADNTEVSINLLDPNGDDCDFEPDVDDNIEENLNDAITFAIEHNDEYEEAD